MKVLFAQQFNKFLHSLTKISKKRLGFLVASPLAIAVTGLASAGIVYAAASSTYNMVMDKDKPEPIAEQAFEQPAANAGEEGDGDVVPPSTTDTNSQDLMPDRHNDTSISRDTRYSNVHDMGQSFLPQCTNSWRYIAPNGDTFCMANNWGGSACNYAYIMRIAEGVDGATLAEYGHDGPSGQGGVSCSSGPTKADVYNDYFSPDTICASGIYFYLQGNRSCDPLVPLWSSIMRNPNYIPPNGQE